MAEPRTPQEHEANMTEFERLYNAFGPRLYRDNPHAKMILDRIAHGAPVEEILVAAIKGLLEVQEDLQGQLLHALQNQWPVPVMVIERPPDV